jgi:hypothetical protein
MHRRRNRQLNKMFERQRAETLSAIGQMVTELELMISDLDTLGMAIPANHLSLACESLRARVTFRQASSRAN